MRIQSGRTKKYTSRRIKASEEMMDEDIDMKFDEEGMEDATVTVDPEATELVFEAEDVAELIAEVSGQEVEVTVDENSVVFNVGDQQFTVEPDGDEEILEASRKVLRGKKPVRASRQMRQMSRATRTTPSRRRRHI